MEKLTLNSTCLDLSLLLDNADGDLDFINEILNNYLNDMPVQLEILKTKLEEKNIGDIVFQAHRMKNNSQICGVEPLSQLLFSIEEDVDNGIIDLNFEELKNNIQQSVEDSILLINQAKNILNN